MRHLVSRQRPANDRLRTCCGLAVAALVVAAMPAVGAERTPTPTHLIVTASDRQTMAEMALQWAIKGGIADFALVKTPDKIVVADLNLPKDTVLKLPDRTVTVLALSDIQARANQQGDFLYFRFGPLTEKGTGIRVALSLVWSVSVKSTVQYMSGGGATLDFEKRDGKWTLLPVTEHWMS